MASSSSGANQWKKTSEPKVEFDRTKGKWRLRMQYTASSKKRTEIVRSVYFSTREEVEATIPWWRLGWEQGHRGKKVDPPTPPGQERSSGSAPASSSVAAALPPGELWVCWFARNIVQFSGLFFCCATSSVLSCCSILNRIC